VTVSRSTSTSRAVSCPNCRALNGVDFDRCVRCGAALAHAVTATDPIRGHVEGGSLVGTKLIIGATTFVFALQIADILASFGPTAIGAFLYTGSASNALRFGAALLAPAYVAREPWRLLSAVFVHYGFLHFVMNMLSAANLGRIAEPLVGSARFIAAYLIAGLVGFMVTAVQVGLHGASYGTTAGASGAVLGVLGVLIGFHVRRRDPRFRAYAMQALIYGVLFGFAVNASGLGVMINNSAHIGGLTCGALLGFVYGGARPRSDLFANLLAGLCVLASIVALALAARSPVALPRWRELSTIDYAFPRPEASPTARLDAPRRGDSPPARGKKEEGAVFRG
jgi:rhomboid protease GluP